MDFKSKLPFIFIFPSVIFSRGWISIRAQHNYQNSWMTNKKVASSVLQQPIGLKATGKEKQLKREFQTKE